MSPRIFLIFLFFLIGCSANQSDRSRMERAKHLLDQREYSQAIDLLEKDFAKDPSNRTIALTLAQAHLGAAGIELFEFITGVFGAQGPRESLDLVVAPKCDDDAIRKIQGFDFRCLAMRLLHRLPDADNVHVDRAKMILRKTFPFPASTPIDVNFLAAFVELGSGFARLKVLLKRTLLQEIQKNAAMAPAELPYALVIHHLKRLLSELSQGISRAKYSYGKISKYVLQYEGKPLIKIGGSSLAFGEDLSMPTLLRFIISVLHEKSETVDRELNSIVMRNVNNFGSGIIRVLQSIDGVYFSNDGTGVIETMFHFERAINGFLAKIADASGNAAENIDVFELVWNNPPAILKTFASAALNSWEYETAEPLKQYFTSTKDGWNELNRIMNDWEDWMNKKLSSEQHDQLILYLGDVQKREKEIFKLPAHLTPDQVQVWHSRLVAKLNTEMTAILSGRVPSIPTIEPEKVQEGLNLLQKSKSWIEQNFWPL